MLAISHLITLGVLAMVMCGAMFQLLPVLAGVRVACPRLVGGLCHLLLVLGTFSLAAGFLGNSEVLFLLAVVLLALAFALFVGVIGAGLLRAPRPGDSVRGMRWALAGLAVVVATGVVLGLGHSGLLLPLPRHLLTDLHLVWGLVGWVAALVIVVAFQVVPMFQMTPPYPPLLRRWLAVVLFVLLSWLTAAVVFNWAGAVLPALLLAAVLATFGVLTLRLLSRRQRKVGDASLSFWRLGMAALVVTALLAIWQLTDPPLSGSPWALAPALLFVLSFALSVINGMLYKIVPFLVWLHLQQHLAARPAATGTYMPPTMRTILPERHARLHLHLHLTALAALLAGLYNPVLVRPAAVIWMAAFAVLAVNLFSAVAIYRKIMNSQSTHQSARV